ncbi:hypothetical protein DY000_02053089 [Brassica cretica]|uniref:Uncharacterized protein n=1 Tax=Brassica cretica TaxID=69181 RepID=A0ABQ7A6C2_BRACR|nr:hypothetical protein DY000_02053089 [Brassica cretica]
MRKIRNRNKERKVSYSEFAYERYNKVEASAMRPVGEIPSSNNLRLQNLVESQLEITKTKSCLNALSAKFALKNSLSGLLPRIPYILPPRYMHMNTINNKEKGLLIQQLLYLERKERWQLSYETRMMMSDASRNQTSTDDTSEVSIDTTHGNT